ncbi:helix-turn-helix transcriptional regulator [Yoonia sp. BS5-3]|uniref:Helix-turn-helix domain-containing protein n=1 Tax=Yoonia phaeophyticola TaxID=3137369 RepID=A0ABZ2V7X4_9RHOB
MADIAIDAPTLKTIRKARKLGRPRLARLAGLSERQLSRLEQAAAGAGMQTDTLSRLALALDVPEGVLTGAIPVTEADLTPLAASKCTSGCCG